MERYYIGSRKAVEKEEERERYMNTISDLQATLFSTEKVILDQIDRDIDGAVKLYIKPLFADNHKDLIVTRVKNTIKDYLNEWLLKQPPGFWEYFFSGEFAYHFSYRISYNKNIVDHYYAHKDVDKYEDVLIDSFKDAAEQVLEQYNENEKNKSKKIINEVKEVDIGLN